MQRLELKLELEWRRFEALTANSLYELLRFRQSIFVVEQRSPYPDLDTLDRSGWHLLLHVEAQLSGYLRLTPTAGPPAPVRIGRVAVAPHLRGCGIGRMLMEHALSFCREHFPLQPIALAAQLRLAAYYESFGFAAVSDPYDDFGVEHIDMILRPEA